MPPSRALSDRRSTRIGALAAEIAQREIAPFVAAKYGPVEVTEVVRTSVWGEPDPEHITTAMDLDAARLLTYRAAALADAGQAFALAASRAKLFASTAARKHAAEALQIHGSYGYTSGVSG